MKQKIAVLMLALSITGTLLSQQTKTDKVFDIPSYFSFGRKFNIDLGTGNTLRVEISDITDLSRIYNIDSLLKTIIKDLEPLSDSLKDPLTSKRIDYMMDTSGYKKIRFRQTSPQGSSFLLQQGDVAAMKIEQDSLFIIGIIQNPPKPAEKISTHYPRFYRFSFYINNLSELSQYINTGLNEKLRNFRQDYSSKWGGVAGMGKFTLKKDPSITSPQRRAQVLPPKDYLVFRIDVAMQNYKNYFVPSFGLGAAGVFSNRDRKFRREIGLNWQPQFLFAKDANDKLQTYRNDFLELTLSQGLVTDNDPRKENSFLTTFSFAYLIYRNGDYYDKGTMRFGAGKLKLKKTTIEPAIYFTDFFRGVTPSIRIAQHF